MVSRTVGTKPRERSRAIPQSPAKQPRPSNILVPIDLPARNESSSGQAGAGFVRLDGTILDGDNTVVGHVRANGVVYSGSSPVALVEHDQVHELAGGRRTGQILGSVRLLDAIDSRLAYLCDLDDDVTAFLLLDRRTADLGREQLAQLAGAALALLQSQL